MANANNRRGQLRRSKTMIIILALGLLVGMTSTAAADHSQGEGVGTGTEDLTHVDPSGAPTCLRVTASEYVVGDDVAGDGQDDANTGVTGLFTAHDGTQQAETTGPSKITITTKNPYRINPAGTFEDSNTTCSGPTQFVRVDVTVKGEVECALAENGLYRRTNTTFEVYWTQTCTILDDDGNPVSTGSVKHAFIGDLLPCVGCADDAQTLQGTWTYPRAADPIEA